MVAVDIKDRNESKDLSPYGTIGFYQKSLTSLGNPLSKLQITPKDELEVSAAKSGKPKSSLSENFDAQADRSKQDDNLASSWLLLAAFAEKKNASDEIITSSSLVTFVNSLEALGVDTKGIKQVIENVSGQPYDSFVKSDGNRQFGLGDFYSKEKTGVNIPHINNAGFNSALAIRISQTDNAGAGYCAKGTANILERMGIPIERGHATGWDEKFDASRNWVRLRNVSPGSAPEGAVLTYDSDLERGKRARNDGGGKFGHVEVVAHDRNGNNVFVSDKARSNWGGSVPDNYAGAFMYVGPGAPASNLQIANQINHGGPQMAQAHHAPAPALS